jgi:hypothetical protein
MFELQYFYAGGKSWILFKDGLEIRSGDKVFIRKWLGINHPEVDYKSLKIKKARLGYSPRTLYNVSLLRKNE